MRRLALAALALLLVNAPVLAASPADETAVDAASKPSSLRSWAWLPAGVGVLAAWGGAFLLIDARSKYARLHDGPDTFTTRQADAFAQSGDNEQKLGVAAATVGLAGLATGALFYALCGRSETVQVAIAPSPSGFAARLSWSFR